jgi:hypothetical protein
LWRSRSLARRSRDVELRKARATDVAHLATLHGVPDPCDGVTIRRVARKLLQMDALVSSGGQEVLAGLAAVTWGSIPDAEEYAANPAQEQAQETDYLGARNWAS